jgi:hypothetical protein
VKNKIIVLMMALMIVGLAAGNAAASEWEAVGGLAITETTLDAWNEKIDRINTVFDGSNPKVPVPASNVEEMDNIDRVPMIYLGARKQINEKWAGVVRYEHIFGKIEGSSTLQGLPEPKHEGEIEVKLNGLAFLGEYELNDRWSLNGGVAIYNGDKSKKFSGSAFKGNPATPADAEYDLDAVSYRAGVKYAKAFAENWDFNANLDYLYMEIDDADPTEPTGIYSAGFSYGVGVTYSF